MLYNVIFVKAESNSEYMIYCPNYNTVQQTITLYQLLDCYEAYSTAAWKVRNDYMLNSSNSDILYDNETKACNNVDNTKNNFTSLEESKNELLTLKESLLQEYKTLDKIKDQSHIVEIDTEINDIENKLKTIEEQLGLGSNLLDTNNVCYQESILKSNIGSFYTNNRDLIINKDMNEIKYDLVKNICKLIALNEQTKYYNTYNELVDLKITVESKKVKLGIVNVEDKEKLEAEKKTNQSLIQSNNDTYKLLYDSITKQANCANTTIKLDYMVEAKEYNKDDRINNFNFHYPDLLQLSYSQNAYDNYKNTLSDELLKKQIEYTVSNYDIQRLLLENSIRQYVNMACIEYNSVVNKLGISQDTILLMNKQYNKMKKKYDLGRATQLNVKEAECNLQKAYIDFYNILVEKILLEYILDNHVYGVEYK